MIFLVYVKYEKDYRKYFEKECKFPEFLKKIIYVYKKLFGKITKVKNEYGEVLLIPNDNEKFKNSLVKYLKIYHIKTLVLSNSLLHLKSILEEKQIQVLEGKWLYKYLLGDIVNFICENKHENLQEQTISFAVNNPDELDYENLKNLAKACRSVNLITKTDYKFKRIEENLYKGDGIILNIAYNYKKSFLKSGIIINVDLSEKEFNKFALPRKGVVINLQRIKIYSKGFNGINILRYEIDFPDKYKDEMLSVENFNKEVLYESFLYRKTLPKNILKIIKKDDVKIARLLGKNGYIDEKEYSKI